MVPIDAYMKGFTALFTGILAALLLSHGGRRGPSRIHGMFLLLISVNAAAEALRAVLWDWEGVPDTPQQLAAFRVASIVASLDPVVLYWFVASYPEPNELGRPARLALVGVAGGALAVYAGWALTFVSAPYFTLALTLFTLPVYIGLLVWAIDRLRRNAVEEGWRFLVPALSVASLPSIGVRVLTHLQAALGLPRIGPEWVTGPALMVVVSGALLARVRRAAPPVRKVVAGSLLVACALAAFFFVESLLDSLPAFRGRLKLTYSVVQWVLFGTFASMAVFRGRVLGWSLHVRRRAARLFLGAVFLLVGGSLVLAIQAGPVVSFTLTDAAVLLVALALSQGFGKLVDEVALRVYGVPKPGDADTAKAVYRRAAAEALSQGREPSRDAELQRLREELAIDAEIAVLLERLAEEELPGPITPGRLVSGRYAVRRMLGRGSAGRAFLARDAVLERDVVLKEILSGEDGEDKEALREARAAGGLRHPNIVTVHDVLRRAGATYLVTEFAEGGSLADRAPMPPADALPLLRGLVEGVAAAHARGIVHRDIKPQNVLVAADGTLKLADFGIASRPGTASTGNALAGTPDFMAPEQRRGERATPASDVYALGLLVRRVVRAPLPPALEAVVQRATRDRPEERFESAAEMAGALRGGSLPVQ